MKSLLSKNAFLSITLCYSIIIILLQLMNGWYQNFSDAVHYLWIADKYAEGDWQNAINTYWGPMISWIILIFKPLIQEPFVRFRIIQLALGLSALLLIQIILKKKSVSKEYAVLFSLVSIPLIASFAWFYLTPDLLLLNGILICILFFSKDRLPGIKTAILTAVVGALLFYIKSVGLYVFILILLGKFISERKQWNIQSFLHNCSIAFFLLLFCSPWIYLISKKNGSFTMGTSSGHNYKMNAPRITPDIYGEVGNPYHLGTLTEPNPSNAFDACVEHAHQNYLSWEGMSVNEIRNHYLNILIKNIKSARSMFFGIDIGTLFVILLCVGFFIDRKKLKAFLVENNILLLIFIANVILYLPFFFMDRYTWPGLISLFFLAILLLFYIPQLNNKRIIWSVTLLFLGLNCLTLYKEYIYSLPEKPITTAIWDSRQKLELKRTIWLCRKEDKRLGLVKGLIYYNKGQYLGALFTEKENRSHIEEQLNQFNINTIVVLDSVPDSLLNMQTYQTTDILNSSSIKAYRVSKKVN